MINRAFGYLVTVIVLLLSVGEAFAQAPPPAVFFWALLRDGVTVTRNLDRDNVCIMRTADRNSWIPNDPVVFMSSAGLISNSSGTCYANRPPATTAIDVGTWRRTGCTTAMPYFDPNIGCVAANPPPPPPLCPKGSTYTGTYAAGKASSPGLSWNPFGPGVYGTDGQCEVKYTDVEECHTYPPSDDSFCTYTGTRTGEQRNPSDGSPAPSTPPPAGTPEKPQTSPPYNGSSGSCPGGTVQAGVSSDGTPICMGSGKNPKPPTAPPPKIETSKSEATPDGGTKTTNTTVTSNSDGSKTTTTTTTTTAADGTKTTNVSKDTTASASGGSGKDESAKDDEKFDLCKQNPMLTICRNSSVSGTCGAITCQGDAIQCATLRAAAAMECKQRQDETDLKTSPLSAKGAAAVNGTDLAGLPNSKNGAIVNISTLAGTEGWLGGGSAFDDISVTVQGHQIIVPLAKWSGYLVSLRYALMIIASLISFRILGSAILKE